MECFSSPYACDAWMAISHRDTRTSNMIDSALLWALHLLLIFFQITIARTDMRFYGLRTMEDMQLA